MKLQHPSPGQPPGHLNFWRLACSNSLPSGQKGCSNAPPISTEIPLLKDKFRLQSNTLQAFQSEICHNDTFKLLLKTLLKELFTNKGEILSWNSVRPCKNRKKSQAYYVRTRDRSGSNSPPFQHNVQIPPSLGTMHSQMPGVCPGGMLNFRIDRRISSNFIINHHLPPLPYHHHHQKVIGHLTCTSYVNIAVGCFWFLIGHVFPTFKILFQLFFWHALFLNFSDLDPHCFHPRRPRGS